jgi:hypothetical protein
MSPTSDDPTENIKLRRETLDKKLLKCFPDSGFVEFEVIKGKVDFLSERHLRLRLYECSEKDYLTQVAKRGLSKDNPLKKLRGLYLYELTEPGKVYRETPTPPTVKRKKNNSSKGKYNPELDCTDDKSIEGPLVEEIKPGVRRFTNMYLFGHASKTPEKDPKTLINSVFQLFKTTG